MDTAPPTRPARSSGFAEDDPMRSVYLAALDGDNDFARLLLAYLAVLSDEDD